MRILHSRFAGVDGFRTRYFESDAECGARQGTIVLVPSMFLLARSYRPTVRALTHCGFRVIVFELPGTGLSARTAASWSFEDHAFWLMSAVEAIGLHRPVLVGHSVSAPAVMTAAARHPSRVGAIVVCDSVGGRDGADRMSRIIPGRLIDAIDELAFDIRSAPDALFNAAHHPCDCLHQLALTKLSLVHIAQRVHTPTLLAWGARDRTTPMRYARKLRELMPGASFYLSRQGCHDWIIDRAEEFARIVRTFVQVRAERSTNERSCESINYRAARDVG